MFSESAKRMVSGSEFHSAGPAQEKNYTELYNGSSLQRCATESPMVSSRFTKQVYIIRINASHRNVGLVNGAGHNCMQEIDVTEAIRRSSWKCCQSC